MEVMDEHAEKGAKKVFSLGNLRLYECPLCYLTDDTREMMRLVFLADASGVLMHGNGWADQDAWFVEAYEIFRVESARHVKKDAS